MHVLIPNLAALAALLPATLLPLRRNATRDRLFWTLIGLAVAGPVAWTLAQLSGAWRTNLSTDLWAGVSASLVVFAAVALVNRQAWRVAPLLMPYLFALGALASLFATVPAPPMSGAVPAAWVDLHIILSILTLGLLTVAASAALASFLQARALKTKQANRLTRLLPAVIDSEWLFERLLIVSEIILASGVATGMATQYDESGVVLRFDHKSILTLSAFAVIGMLLIGRRVCGVRGQMAARVVLSAYMLVILGYFGVKFVRQVLLG